MGYNAPGESTASMKVLRSRLMEAAQTRPSAYLDDINGVAHWDGDWVTIPDADYLRIAKKYQAYAPKPEGKLLGDRIAAVASPFKRALGHLHLWQQDCRCEARRQWLNAQHRRLRAWCKRAALGLQKWAGSSR